MAARSGGTHEAFGAYVRSQRQLAQLTLRQTAELARISNPYLSQIEHGLALPSITVLNALAAALEVSADTLLQRAAGAPAAGGAARGSTEDSIRHDDRLDDAQKRALLAVLASFVGTPPKASRTAASPKTTRRRRPPAATAGQKD